MTDKAAPVPIKLKFAEVTLLLNVAEYGLKSAINEDRKAASPFAKPVYGLLFGKHRKAEYEPLLNTLRAGVTESKAYGSCEITLTWQQIETLSTDYSRYQQAFTVPPENQGIIGKITRA